MFFLVRRLLEAFTIHRRRQEERVLSRDGQGIDQQERTFAEFLSVVLDLIHNTLFPHDRCWVD